jgi:hypothetical protein
VHESKRLEPPVFEAAALRSLGVRDLVGRGARGGARCRMRTGGDERSRKLPEAPLSPHDAPGEIQPWPGLVGRDGGGMRMERGKYASLTCIGLSTRLPAWPRNESVTPSHYHTITRSPDGLTLFRS